jgi:hypothetical protein
VSILDDLITTDPIPGGMSIHGPMPRPIEMPIPPDFLQVVRIGDPRWAEIAIDELLNEEPVGLIDDRVGPILVEPWHLRSQRRPVWSQLREILKREGVHVPRVRWSW